MSPLSVLLLIKIFGTLFTVALPFILFSSSRIEALSGFKSADKTLYRLYGVAILALLVGYSGGYVQAQAGVFPLGIVLMGLVSNAGAVLVLILNGRLKTAPLAIGFFGFITAGLLIALFAKPFAMSPLW